MYNEVLKKHPRLIELRAALILNAIYRKKDKGTVNSLLRIFKCVVLTYNRNLEPVFDKFLIRSVNENLLGATKKEIGITLQLFYDVEQRRKEKFGNTDYDQIKMLDYLGVVDAKFIERLEPELAMLDNYLKVAKIIVEFGDNFVSRITGKDGEFKYHPRTLELKFYYMFQDFLKFFISEEKTITFFQELSHSLKADIDVINKMLIKKNEIMKGFEERITQNRWLVQELANLGYIEGRTKSFISEEFLKKAPSYLSTASTKRSANMLGNDKFMKRMYVPVILKDTYSVLEVTKIVEAIEHIYQEYY